MGPTTSWLLTGLLVAVLVPCAAIAFADRGQRENRSPAPGTQNQAAPVETCPGRAPLSKDDAPRGVLRVGKRAGITQPSRLAYVRPIYPDRAKDQGIRGVVILEALIDRQGTVRSTQILRSIPLLDQAAAEAVCQWQYSPAVVNEVPTATALTIAVNFPPRENAP